MKIKLETINYYLRKIGLVLVIWHGDEKPTLIELTAWNNYLKRIEDASRTN